MPFVIAVLVFYYSNKVEKLFHSLLMSRSIMEYCVDYSASSERKKIGFRKKRSVKVSRASN